MSKFFYLLIFSLCITTFAGCAAQQKTDTDESWSKEVKIVFRRDITDFEIRQFLDRNQLELTSQYDDYIIRARIRSGESIADFIDRVKDDPYVDQVEEYREKN